MPCRISWSGAPSFLGSVMPTGLGTARGRWTRHVVGAWRRNRCMSGVHSLGGAVASSHRGLVAVEARRPGGSSSVRHDTAIGRRRRRNRPRCSAASKDGLPGWIHVSRMHQLTITHSRPRYNRSYPVDGSTRRESGLGSRRNCARYIAVCPYSGKIVVVVVIRNVRDVGNVRVGDINIVQVCSTHIAAAVIPAAMSPSTVARIVGRAPAQWEPAKADTDPEAAAAPAKTNAEAGSVLRSIVTTREECSAIVLKAS